MFSFLLPDPPQDFVDSECTFAGF